MGHLRRSSAAVLACLSACGDAGPDAMPSEWDFDPACAFVEDSYHATITSVAIEGTVAIEGAATASVKLSFVGRGGEGTAEITAQDGTFSATLIPGIYDVYYEGGIGEGVPKNKHVLFRSAFDVTGPTSLSLTIPAVTIGGAIRVAGEVLVGVDCSQPARLILWGREHEEPISVAYTDDFVAGRYEVTVIPGRYDVQYSRWSDGFCPEIGVPGTPPERASLPNDHRGIAIEDLVLTVDATVDIDVPLSRVDGLLSWDDRSPIRGVELVSTDRRSAARYRLEDGTLSGFVMSGVYDVYVEAKGPVLSGWKASGDSTLSMAVPLVDIEGRIELEAGAVTALDPDAFVAFEAPIEGLIGGYDSADLSPDGRFSIRLPIGVYTLLLLGDDIFEQTLERELLIDAPLDYRRELSGARVETSITAAGLEGVDIRPSVRAAFPGGGPTEWVVRQLVYRGTAGEAIVPRGTYDILFERYLAEDAPEWIDHRFAWLARGVDVEDGARLDLHLPLRSIEVSASIDGDEVTSGSDFDDAVGVHRRGDPSGFPTLVGSPSGGEEGPDVPLPPIRGPGLRTLLPGTYDVYFDNEDETAELPANREAIVDCFNVR